MIGCPQAIISYLRRIEVMSVAKYIPVLHNLAVLIEMKDIYPCVVIIPRPLLVTMENNETTRVVIYQMYMVAIDHNCRL